MEVGYQSLIQRKQWEACLTFMKIDKILTKFPLIL